MIDGQENVVRVLFPNKVLHGKVMGGAFVLRPHREEQDISVFRMGGPTFTTELQRLDAGRNLQCSVMNVAEIRNASVRSGANVISCDVVATGALSITAHAGIVISVNGQKLVGGHEAEMTISVEKGESMDVLLLAMQHKLASLAQKGLTCVASLVER